MKSTYLLKCKVERDTLCKWWCLKKRKHNASIFGLENWLKNVYTSPKKPPWNESNYQVSQGTAHTPKHIMLSSVLIRSKKVPLDSCLVFSSHKQETLQHEWPRRTQTQTKLKPAASSWVASRVCLARCKTFFSDRTLIEDAWCGFGSCLLGAYSSFCCLKREADEQLSGLVG